MGTFKIGFIIEMKGLKKYYTRRRLPNPKGKYRAKLEIRTSTLDITQSYKLQAILEDYWYGLLIVQNLIQMVSLLNLFVKKHMYLCPRQL